MCVWEGAGGNLQSVETLLFDLQSDFDLMDLLTRALKGSENHVPWKGGGQILPLPAISASIRASHQTW